jgi:hypothetical protein
VLDGPLEVAVVGDPDDPGYRDLVATTWVSSRPGLVVVTGRPDEPDALPLLASRGLVDGRAAAYVCRGMVCDRPVTTVDELRGSLA